MTGFVLNVSMLTKLYDLLVAEMTNGKLLTSKVGAVTNLKGAALLAISNESDF